MSKWTPSHRKSLERYTDLNYFNDNPYISQDLFRFLCGEKISSGAYRTVFECSLIKKAVVKITEDIRSNMTEFEVWQSVKGTPQAKWFAPCIEISPCGHFLIQSRIKPLPAEFKLPKRLPGVFTDVKKTNWGLLGKQLVCHDYQFIDRAIDCGFATMKDVQWLE